MKNQIALILLFGIYALPCTAHSTNVPKDTMVESFYDRNNQQLYWFTSNKTMKKANEWLTLIELENPYASVVQKLQFKRIRLALSQKYLFVRSNNFKIDKQITGLVLHFLKDQQQGNVQTDYDEISIHHDSVYVIQLLKSNNEEPVSKIVSSFECKDLGYIFLKNYLADSISINDTLKYKAIKLAMNYRLYLSINHLSEYFVVNILSATAEYYKNDMLVVGMRVVVGKKANQTPILASYITSITTFPYWNVPHSIAVKEILPKVQKDGKYLEQKGFDVIDAKGDEVDESDLNWTKYTEETFPYFFRQSTGGDNALGVLKFNINNPYSIFLHATSNQAVFTKTNRFLSHGCIRLEKPFELANALLNGNLDVESLKKNKKDTEPTIIMLPHKIPTFIIYMPVQFADNRLTFLPDIYNLIK